MHLQKYQRNICACKNSKGIYALAKILKEYMHLQKYQRNICACKSIEAQDFFAATLRLLCDCPLNNDNISRASIMVNP